MHRFSPLVLALAVAATVLAQPRPDFSGTWTPEDQAPLSAPRRLVITQSAAELAVLRATARGEDTSTYRLDGVETVESNMLGDTRVQAGWQGSALVVTRTRTLSGPEGPVPLTTTESYALDGGRLRVTTRRPDPQGGERTEAVTYIRAPR